MVRDVNIEQLKKFNYDIQYNNEFTRYIGFFLNGVIIGYLVYEDLYDRYEVDYVFVKTAFRRKNVGSNMMNFLVNKFKKAKYKNITLEVSENNKIAIRLYEKYGFETVAVRKNYYPDSDGLLMEYKL